MNSFLKTHSEYGPTSFSSHFSNSLLITHKYFSTDLINHFILNHHDSHCTIYSPARLTRTLANHSVSTGLPHIYLRTFSKARYSRTNFTGGEENCQSSKMSKHYQPSEQISSMLSGQVMFPSSIDFLHNVK